MKQTNVPKNFTNADLVNNDHLYVDRDDLVNAPLWYHLQGLQQTASGYGAKLTHSSKISFNGRLYRLYTTIYSNAGSVWFTTKGKRIYVS